MENLEIFTNKEFGSIRTVLRHGEVWFVAKDVCECLEVGNPSQALSRLDDDERNTIILNEGIGNPEKSIINESGLYSLVLSSRKPEAKKFKKWVTSEVLPSIRKTGGYIIEKEDDTPEEIMARALLVAQDTLKRREERIKALESKVEQDKPLVDFAETVSISSDSIEIGTFAKIIKDENIDLGRNKLFEWLRKNKYLMKDNEPYQRYINEKYFQIEEYTITTPYGVKLCKKTVVTGLGQIKLIQKLKSEFGIKF